MILRRLSTALRKQDWFTVVIETLIIVPGEIEIHPLLFPKYFQGRNTP